MENFVLYIQVSQALQNYLAYFSHSIWGVCQKTECMPPLNLCFWSKLNIIPPVLRRCVSATPLQLLNRTFWNFVMVVAIDLHVCRNFWFDFFRGLEWGGGGEREFKFLCVVLILSVQLLCSLETSQLNFKVKRNLSSAWFPYFLVAITLAFINFDWQLEIPYS